jgi:hypothetical protein
VFAGLQPLPLEPVVEIRPEDRSLFGEIVEVTLPGTEERPERLGLLEHGLRVEAASAGERLLDTSLPHGGTYPFRHDAPLRLPLGFPG